ncbi:MAG: hypothetical protein FJ087_10160 [Deltaproteobacteria bacterium]|nr:hypothetical protein [Deltaproteobacteria bacterium]
MVRSPLACLAMPLLLAACGSSPGGGGDPSEVADAVVADVAGGIDTPAADATPDASPAGVAPPVPPKVERRGDVTVVWLSGTPKEMGIQHGRLLHAEIADAMQFVLADPLLSAMPQVVQDTGILDILQAAALPGILEECAGLVEAAGDTGLDFKMCLTLNMGDVALAFVQKGIPPEAPVARMTWSAFTAAAAIAAARRESPAFGPGCTGVVATGAATPDGRVYHSRNLDWGGMDFSITQKYPVVFVRQPAGGIPHVYVGFPLNLSPYTGMNEAGISIGTHQAHPASMAELSRTGASNVQTTAVILRDARTLEEAEALVRRDRHMMTGILVLADGASNTGAVFEYALDQVEKRRPDENGVVYAVNHFISPAMTPKGAKPSSGSILRWMRLKGLADPGGEESIHGRLDPAGLADVMQDVTDPATGEVPTLDDLAAVAWDNGKGIGCNGAMHLALFDPGRRLFWVAAGVPPLHVKPYACFSLDELLGRPGAPACPAPEIPGVAAPSSAR